MASQPLTGVNQQPLVFAQITQGVSSPEKVTARIVTSSRVIDIKSNMFLHLFYSKPYQRDQGYNHSVDKAYGFQVKSDPAEDVYRNDDILAAGENDVGDMKTEQISEREFLTMSTLKTWNFKPSTRVADFFANSLGIPIDCWTPCSRIAISRELEACDLIKYELQCGDSDRNACAMTAGELAESLHDGDQLSFDECEDLTGYVQLSILFQNENPNIQNLDFRLRMRIMPCRCPPVLVKVPTADNSGDFDYYRAKITPEKCMDSGYHYVLDDEITEAEAKCLGYDVSSKPWKYPAAGSIEQVKASNFMDAKGETEILNMDKSITLKDELMDIEALNEFLKHEEIDFLTITASSLVVCEHDIVTLKAEGADSYLWSNDKGVDEISFTHDRGTYTYKVIGRLGSCESEKEITIEFLPRPDVVLKKTGVVSYPTIWYKGAPKYKNNFLYIFCSQVYYDTYKGNHWLTDSNNLRGEYRKDENDKDRVCPLNELNNLDITISELKKLAIKLALEYGAKGWQILATDVYSEDLDQPLATRGPQIRLLAPQGTNFVLTIYETSNSEGFSTLLDEHESQYIEENVKGGLLLFEYFTGNEKDFFGKEKRVIVHPTWIGIGDGTNASIDYDEAEENDRWIDPLGDIDTICKGNYMVLEAVIQNEIDDSTINYNWEHKFHGHITEEEKNKKKLIIGVGGIYDLTVTMNDCSTELIHTAKIKEKERPVIKISEKVAGDIDENDNYHFDKRYNLKVSNVDYHYHLFRRRGDGFSKSNLDEWVSISEYGLNRYSSINGEDIHFYQELDMGRHRLMVWSADEQFCWSNSELLEINVVPHAQAGENLTICQGDQVTLTGKGGLSLTWTGNHGENITNGQKFTPGNADNTWGEFTYKLTAGDGSDNLDLADSTDTVKVDVIPVGVEIKRQKITGGELTWIETDNDGVTKTENKISADTAGADDYTENKLFSSLGFSVELSEDFTQVLSFRIGGEFIRSHVDVQNTGNNDMSRIIGFVDQDKLTEASSGDLSTFIEFGLEINKDKAHEVDVLEKKQNGTGDDVDLSSYEFLSQQMATHPDDMIEVVISPAEDVGDGKASKITYKYKMSICNPLYNLCGKTGYEWVQREFELESLQSWAFGDKKYRVAVGFKKSDTDNYFTDINLDRITEEALATTKDVYPGDVLSLTATLGDPYTYDQFKFILQEGTGDNLTETLMNGDSLIVDKYTMKIPFPMVWGVKNIIVAARHEDSQLECRSVPFEINYRLDEKYKIHHPIFYPEGLTPSNMLGSADGKNIDRAIRGIDDTNRDLASINSVFDTTQMGGVAMEGVHKWLYNNGQFELYIDDEKSDPLISVNAFNTPGQQNQYGFVVNVDDAADTAGLDSIRIFGLSTQDSIASHEYRSGMALGEEFVQVVDFDGDKMEEKHKWLLDGLDSNNERSFRLYTQVKNQDEWTGVWVEGVDLVEGDPDAEDYCVGYEKQDVKIVALQTDLTKGANTNISLKVDNTYTVVSWSVNIVTVEGMVIDTAPLEYTMDLDPDNTSAHTGFIVYTLDPQPNAGIYEISALVKDDNNCTGIGHIRLEVKPDIDLSGTITNYCIDNLEQFKELSASTTATATEVDGTIAFAWYRVSTRDGTEDPVDKPLTEAFKSLPLNGGNYQSGKYTYKAETIVNGVKNSDTIEITVTALPELTVKLGNSGANEREEILIVQGSASANRLPLKNDFSADMDAFTFTSTTTGASVEYSFDEGSNWTGSTTLTDDHKYFENVGEYKLQVRSKVANGTSTDFCYSVVKEYTIKVSPYFEIHQSGIGTIDIGDQTLNGIVLQGINNTGSGFNYELSYGNYTVNQGVRETERYSTDTTSTASSMTATTEANGDVTLKWTPGQAGIFPVLTNSEAFTVEVTGTANASEFVSQRTYRPTEDNRLTVRPIITATASPAAGSIELPSDSTSRDVTVNLVGAESYNTDNPFTGTVDADEKTFSFKGTTNGAESTAVTLTYTPSFPTPPTLPTDLPEYITTNVGKTYQEALDDHSFDFTTLEVQLDPGNALTDKISEMGLYDASATTQPDAHEQSTTGTFKLVVNPKPKEMTHDKPCLDEVVVFTANFYDKCDANGLQEYKFEADDTVNWTVWKLPEAGGEAEAAPTTDYTMTQVSMFGKDQPHMMKITFKKLGTYIVQAVLEVDLTLGGETVTGSATLRSQSFNITDPQPVNITYKYANSWDNTGKPNGYTGDVRIADAVGHSHTEHSVASQCAQDNPFEIPLSQHDFANAKITFPADYVITSIDGNDVSAQTPTAEFSLADLVDDDGNVDENWQESASGESTRFEPNKIFTIGYRIGNSGVYFTAFKYVEIKKVEVFVVDVSSEISSNRHNVATMTQAIVDDTTLTTHEKIDAIITAEAAKANVEGLVRGLDGNLNMDVSLYDQTNRNTSGAIVWQYSLNPNNGFETAGGSSLSDIVAVTGDIATIFPKPDPPGDGGSLSVYFRYSVGAPAADATLSDFCYFKLNLTYTVEEEPNYTAIYIGMSGGGGLGYGADINAVAGDYDDRLKIPLIKDQATGNLTTGTEVGGPLTMEAIVGGASDLAHTASDITTDELKAWAASQSEDYFIGVVSGSQSNKIRAYVRRARFPESGVAEGTNGWSNWDGATVNSAREALVVNLEERVQCITDYSLEIPMNYVSPLSLTENSNFTNVGDAGVIPASVAVYFLCTNPVGQVIDPIAAPSPQLTYMDITTDNLNYNQLTNSGKLIGLSSYLGMDGQGKVTAINGGGHDTGDISKVTFSQLTHWLCEQTEAYFIGLNATNLEQYVPHTSPQQINSTFFVIGAKGDIVLNSWVSSLPYKTGDTELKVEVFLRKASDLSGNSIYTLPDGAQIPDLDQDFITALEDDPAAQISPPVFDNTGKLQGTDWWQNVDATDQSMAPFWNTFSHIGGPGRNALYYFNPATPTANNPDLDSIATNLFNNAFTEYKRVTTDADKAQIASSAAKLSKCMSVDAAVTAMTTDGSGQVTSGTDWSFLARIFMDDDISAQDIAEWIKASKASGTFTLHNHWSKIWGASMGLNGDVVPQKFRDAQSLFI